MKKIIPALGIIILSFILFIKTLTPVNANVATQSATDINCIKGDKIVDYYETLTDKTDSEKYLNAAKYFYFIRTQCIQKKRGLRALYKCR